MCLLKYQKKDLVRQNQNLGVLQQKIMGKFERSRKVIEKQIDQFLNKIFNQRLSHNNAEGRPNQQVPGSIEVQTSQMQQENIGQDATLMLDGLKRLKNSEVVSTNNSDGSFNQNPKNPEASLMQNDNSQLEVLTQQISDEYIKYRGLSTSLQLRLRNTLKKHLISRRKRKYKGKVRTNMKINQQNDKNQNLEQAIKRTFSQNVPYNMLKNCEGEKRKSQSQHNINKVEIQVQKMEKIQPETLLNPSPFEEKDSHYTQLSYNPITQFNDSQIKPQANWVDSSGQKQQSEQLQESNDFRSYFNRRQNSNSFHIINWIDKNISKHPQERWLQKLLQLRQFIAKQKPTNQIIYGFWDSEIQKFQNYIFSNEEKLEFIEIWDNFINFNNTNFPVHSAPCIQHFKKIGKKLQLLNTKLYFKHKQCLEYVKFISFNRFKPKLENRMNEQPSLYQNDSYQFYQINKVHQITFLSLKFDLSQEETIKTSQAIKNLCRNDLRAISFLSLYFLKSIDQRISKVEYEVLEQQLQERIRKLDKLNPASSSQSDQQETKQQAQILKSHKYINAFQKIEFNQPTPQGNYQKLLKYIQTRLISAQQDMSHFQGFLRRLQLNQQKLKIDIKVKQNNKLFSQLRIIEKLLQKVLQKHSHELQMLRNILKKKVEKRWYEQYNVREFVNYQVQALSGFIGKILTQQNHIEFDIKDLLRAKCIFQQKEEIIDLVENLKIYLISLNEQTLPNCRQQPKENRNQFQCQQQTSRPSQNYSNIQLVETKNKLSDPTSDFVIYIKLPNGTIAQFQLVLNQNSFKNEFNHKIYQLKRPKLFTSITNLFLTHKKWSNEGLFKQIVQLAQKTTKIKGKTNLSDEEYDLKKFVQQKKCSQFKQLISLYDQNINDPHGSCNNNTCFKFSENEYNQIIHRFLKLKQCIQSQPLKQSIRLIQLFIAQHKYQQAFTHFEKIEWGPNLLNNHFLLIYLEISSEIYLKAPMSSDKRKQGLEQTIKRFKRIYKYSKDSREALVLQIGISKFHQNLKYTVDRIIQINLFFGKQQRAYEWIWQMFSIAQIQMIKERKRNSQFQSRDSHKIELLQKYHSMGEPHILISYLNEIGQIYYTKGNLFYALQIQQTFLQIYKINQVKCPQKLSQCYINLSKIYKAFDRYIIAQKALQNSLHIVEETYGEYSLEVADVLTKLAELNQSMCKYQESILESRKAYFILTCKLGQYHKKTLQALRLNQLARMSLQKMKKWFGFFLQAVLDRYRMQ